MIGIAGKPVAPRPNLIINGNFQIDQRNGGFAFNMTAAQNTRYSADRWQAVLRSTSGLNSYSIQQYPGGPPFQTVLRVQVVTAGVFADLQDYTGINYAVEGFDFAAANFGSPLCKPITLSFWVNANLAGTYGVTFRNSPASRFICATYTVNAINTWEYKTITIPGDSVNAPDPWEKTNGAGFKVFFDLGTAVNSCAPVLPTWNAGLALGVTGVLKPVQNNVGAVWVIANVKLEIGGGATLFEPDTFQESLVKCKRYDQRLASGYVWQTFGAGMVAAGAATSYIAIPGLLPMRTTPTVTYGGIFLSSGAAGNSITSMGVDGANNQQGYNLSIGHSGGGFGVGAGCVIEANNDASAFINFNADF